MDLRDLRYRVRDWTDRVRGDKQRAKLVVVSAVLAIALLALVVSVASVLGGRGRTKALDTPGWRIVDELNVALGEKPAFADTGFVVESERPLKLRVVGGVRTERDLKDLEDFVKQLRPGDQVELSVEVITK